MFTRNMPHEDYFYVRPEDVQGDTLILRKDEMHHLVRVRRKKIGSPFLAIDGQGILYQCLVEQLHTQAVHARILKRRRRVGEPNFQLTLAFALTKGRKFDWVVEKGTEIGISKFIPIVTERTVVPEDSVKSRRWQRIALAAMKQCGRSYLPEVQASQPIGAIWQNSGDYALKLLAHEKSSAALSQIIEQFLENRHLRNRKSGILLIGPEGGFTETEVQAGLEVGFRKLGLGPRRLRSETAALLGTALILEKLGEYN